MDVLCILEPTEKLLARLFSRKKKKKKWKYDDSHQDTFAA